MTSANRCLMGAPVATASRTSNARWHAARVRIRRTRRLATVLALAVTRMGTSGQLITAFGPGRCLARTEQA